MKYTNKLGLPESIYQAIVNDDYDSGNSFLTATQLNKPVQMVKLEKQYEDQIVEDISDNIYALMGKAIHYILEKAESVMIVEERLYAVVMGKQISCQLDRLALITKDGGFTGKVQDYKFASIWQYIYSNNQEYEEQLNVIAYILGRNGYKVSDLEVIMIFRDWQKRKAQYDKNYPQQQVAVIPIKVWTYAEQENFIHNKIVQHESGKFECSDKERWNDGDKFAVMKKGKKKALRVFDNYEDAADMITMGKGEIIETRKGENKRCDNYCRVAFVCSQYKILKGQNE